MLTKALYLLTTAVCTGISVAQDFNKGIRLTPMRILGHVIVGLMWFPIFFIAVTEYMLKEMGFISEDYRILRKKGENND